MYLTTSPHTQTADGSIALYIYSVDQLLFKLIIVFLQGNAQRQRETRTRSGDHRGEPNPEKYQHLITFCCLFVFVKGYSVTLCALLPHFPNSGTRRKELFGTLPPTSRQFERQCLHVLKSWNEMSERTKLIKCALFMPAAHFRLFFCCSCGLTQFFVTLHFVL